MVVRRARGAVADGPRRHRAAHRRGAARTLGARCSATPAWTRIEVAELLVSYRVPDDFLRLAAAVAPAARRGARRACATRRGRRSRCAARRGRARRAVRGARRAHGGGRRAASASSSPRTRARRRSPGTARPPRTRRAASRAGVNLLGLAPIKGLEFDAVVVVEPAAILAERPDGGAGGLYTALTRSTRALPSCTPSRCPRRPPSRSAVRAMTPPAPGSAPDGVAHLPGVNSRKRTNTRPRLCSACSACRRRDLLGLVGHRTVRDRVGRRVLPAREEVGTAARARRSRRR